MFFAQPSVYWFVVVACLAALAAALAAPVLTRKDVVDRLLGRDVTFLGVAAIAFVAMRWPTMFGAEPYIDEAQMIAQAITAEHHPVPWRSFDGTTSGPLNTYVLLLPRLVGLGVSLFGTRLVASALAMVAIGALFFAVRAIYGSGLARLAILPPLILFGLALNLDFTAYSSEILPIALLTVALAAAATIASANRVSYRWSIVAGACCGAVPFAKLQGSVLAVATAAICLAALAYRTRSVLLFARLGGAFVAAALTPAVVILGIVTASGSFGDFVVSYLSQNLSSMAGTSATLQTAFTYDEYRLYFTQTAWMIVAAFAAWLLFDTVATVDEARDRLRGLAPLVSLGLLLLSIYTVEAPHRQYPHYFLFMIVPLGLFAAALAGAARARAGRKRLVVDALLLVYVLTFAVPMYSYAKEGRGADLATVPGGIANAPDPIAQRIAAIDPPGGRVAIWGYAPYLYVKSGTMMGTRDSLAQFSLNNGTFAAYYRKRFLFDVEHNKPALFVDACAPGQFDFKERAVFGFETFPELAAYIKAHYALADEVKGVRIYRRTASAASQTQT